MRPEHWLFTIPLRMRSLFRRAQADQELDDELRDHLEQATEQYVAKGMAPGEAQRRARLDLGGIEQTKEHCRDTRRVNRIQDLMQDLHFGLRLLRKNPGFTSIAVLTLALAIGANTAIFSAVYAVLIKPLPFKNADRMVFILKKNAARGWSRNPIAPAEILAWRNQTEAFEDFAAYTESSCVLTGAGEADEDPCETITSNLFPLLGVAPYRGRSFTSEEDKAGVPRAVILSYGLWQRRFGGDENLIGRSITVNGESHAVVGVMPANLSHLYASPYGSVPGMWVSGIGLAAEHTSNDYFGIARLKPGATLAQASMQMDTVSMGLEKVYPDLHGWRAQLMSFRTNSSAATRPALLVLIAATTFVLLIACANIANLLLARGAGRANEFAIRSALGASQGRLVWQLLTESGTVCFAGGIIGVLLASGLCKGLAALAPDTLLRAAPDLTAGTANVRVLGFAMLTLIATTFLFGLAPALQSAKPKVIERLKEAGRSSLQSPQSRRFRSALVVSEIALALVLLVGAGLMVRTLAELIHVNLGFNPKNILTLRAPLSGDRYKEPRSRAQIWEHVVASVEALPGVEAASVSRGLPITGWSGQYFTTADNPNPPAGQVPDANYVIVGPDYFRTMQIPLRRGRGFNDHDAQSAERVVIVNEKLARTSWPGQDPLGKQLRVGDDAPWLSVIGVAGDVLSQGADGGIHSEMYVPVGQYPWVQGPQHLVVRTSASVKPESLIRAVVEQIHRIDKDVPVTDVETMEQITLESIAQQRMVMALLVSFAGLALGLSTLGIYSVLSYSTAQRTREIGVRMALGAERGRVLRLVVGGGVGLAGLGLAIGIGAALLLTRLMTDLLYGVPATDPLTFVGVSAVLGASSILACYVPARRATKIDPMVALRYE
ncbi:MAG TPA: ABC transporter permease [Terriglobales bacterium]|jgi:putative ABC transport system permease protein|nr:ABC transporter permease [Terriglobales bacterium]